MTSRHPSLRPLPLFATDPLRAVVLLALAAIVWLMGPTAEAQVSFTGSYSQNFDSMGTGSAAPAGWTVHGELGGDKDSWLTDIPASGLPSAATAGTVHASGLITTAPGTSNTRGYNIAATPSSDRSIGTSPTSGAGLAIQLRLTNDTGVPVTALRIGYDIRRFSGPSTVEVMPGYRLFVSSDSGATWANVAALNPVLSGGTVNVPSSVGVTTVAPTDINLPSPVANGSEICLRWIDDNGVPSPDQIISLDNVAIVLPQPAPEVTLTAPAAGASYDLPATVELAADASDSNGTVTKVEFFANGAKLGEDTSAPYTFSWSGMASGAYSLTAVATDNDGGNTTSDAVGITVVNPNNQLPSVTLVSPENGAQIAGSSTTLAATAADSDGTIAKVEFYHGATKLGEDSTAPYTFFWSGVTTGTYSVTARAIDNDGGFTDSSPASVTFVVPVESTLITRRPGSSPGTVWKYLDDGTDQGTAWRESAFDDSAWQSGPAKLGYSDSPNTTLREGPSGMTSSTKFITYYFRRTFELTGAGAVQAIILNVLRDDGAVVYINGVEVARQNMPEGTIGYLTHSSTITDGANESTYFTSTVTELPPLNEGINHIAVEVHQRDSGSSDLGFDLELTTVSLPGTPPAIELTSPVDGATYTAPATVAFAADATDSDGSVVKVEFFNGDEKLGEDTEAPFAFDWTVVPQGDYVLTARATDNYGLTATSDPVSISVGAPNTIFPTVTIISPADSAEFLDPAAIEIAANAADADGSVVKVEFFEGSNKLGETTTAPYTFTWSGVPAGTYTITARATDNLTAATVSAPVTVTVNPNLPPQITLAAPIDGATGLGGSGTVNLVANVSDPEGHPLAVTFYGRPKSAPPGEDFTLVTLPDTQHYSASSSRIAHFQSQTNWIVANRETKNIAFVAHMGDMVNTPGTTAEWTRASGAMAILENPATTLLAHGVPWGGAPGNHDGSYTGDSSSVWDTYFGASRFAGRDYYQGNYSNSNWNNYQFFSAGGMDFIVINLGYNSSTSGNAGVLNWADALLKAYPDRRAIVTSHWLIGESDYPTQAAWGGHGKAVYDKLKVNPNLFMMLCGHIHTQDGNGRRFDVYEGRTVNTMLQDYQDYADGGDSWLRYYTFKPSENKIEAYTYRTRDNTFMNPTADNRFTLDYDMTATAPWTELGTVSLAAGETSATLPWTGLSNGEEYEWYAAVSDGVTPVGSGTNSFTASGNAAPSITLASPLDGPTVKRPAAVELAATAFDPDGTIDRVEFYHGSTKIGEDDTAPYTLSWDAPSGDYTVSARAFDNEGASTDSATATVSVRIDATPPTITGGSVTGGTDLVAGSTATLVATPNSGYRFLGWNVNGVPAGTNATLEIPVTDDMTVEALFAIASVDLSNYVRVGRYGLPEPIRTALPSGTPAHNLLCQEASGVAYNWDTDTLFIVGDGGRSVIQVSKSGVLIDTMTLALGSSSQGTEFYDIEGIAYIGGGQFVMSEERDRQLVKFTYAPGTTLTRAAAQTVKLGTYVDNVGIEDVTFDPITGGYICIKEISPLGIFQTLVDFAAGTASNGSPSTVNSTDLFDPALTGMTDFAGVFALANLPGMAGQAQESHLLVLSQEDGRVVATDRSGTITSTLQIAVSPGDTLGLAEQQHEGMTMDAAGFLYIVNENGGGGIDYPELWVYAPADFPNTPPTGLTLNSPVTELMENTPTLAPIKLGVVAIEDDGLGTNALSLAGPDAAVFELVGSTLYLKAGTVLDFETKSSYSATIRANDSEFGAGPHATYGYILEVLDQEPEAAPLPALLITEVAPWSSGDSPVGADWFEVTNVSESPVNLAGWKVDDSSKSWGAAVALNGIATIAPGESVIFIETSNPTATGTAFLANWFGTNPPAGLQIGSYSGSGIGLSTGGDALWLFDASGQVHSGVVFGASPSGSPLPTFDNTAGLNDTTIGKLSVSGENGAFHAAGNAAEVGSPGYAAPGKLILTEVAPWSSGNSPLGEDWFEVTNVGARVVSIAGWKMDDSSESPVAAVPLQGIYSIAPGESVIFIETNDLAAKSAAFLDLWFGANPPAGLQIGSYSGSGVGLGTGGDAVNLYDTNNVRRANLSFGQSPSSAPYGTFDNSALRENATVALFSVPGVNGAFAAANDPSEVGSPGVLHRSLESILVESRGGEVTASGSLAIGGTAHFTASAAPGYTFRGWRVNGEFSPEASTTLSATVTAGLQVEALFAYTLQLLHLADGEAGLLASETAPYLAALVEAFEGDHDHTLIVSGGDNFIPGPFLGAGTDPSLDAVAAVGKTGFARPDIAIHNLIGVEASAIGNHEWDLGSNVFMDAIRNDGAWIGAQFPYISSNLDYSGDSAANGRFTDVPLDGTATAVPKASDRKTRLVPVAVVEKGGEKIGLVGVTTQILRNISSPSGTLVKGYPAGTPGADDMDLLATHVQPYIDELTAEGIDKIVLLSHLQQIENEQLLATKLRGVDIVLAAGSNTRLGDSDDVAVAFPGHDADFADTYPILTSGLDGKPTLLVCTDSEYTYLGRLVVDFDENGEILVDGLDGRLPVNGAYASTAENVAAAWGVAEAALGSTAFAPGTKGAAVKEVVDAVQSVIHAKDGDIKGYTSVYLEGERNHVRSEETNFGSLTADANAWALRRILDDGTPVVSLKNGGGIRAQIGAIDVATGEKLPPAANPSVNKPSGAISLLDIENALRFNNRLMVFDTTPQGLKALLEHGVAAGTLQGRFPQVGGVIFAWDPALPAGERVTSIALAGESGQPREAIYGDGIFSPWAPPVIRLVTLNFMANDGDGYPSKANGSHFRYLLDDGTLSDPVDPSEDFTAASVLPANTMGEQQAFVELLQDRHATPEEAFAVADTPAEDDLRIQNLAFRTNAVPVDLTLLLGGDGTVGVGPEAIEAGGSRGYRFQLSDRRLVGISAPGSEGFVGELLDAAGNVVATFPGGGPLAFDGILGAGDYLLRIVNPGGQSRSLSLAMAAGAVPTARPDVAMGASLGKLRGRYDYRPLPQQRVALTSRKLRPVRAVAEVSNRSTLPEAMKVKASRSNKRFRVTYTSGGRNATASLVAGSFTTAALKADSSPVLVSAKIAPQKKRLQVKQGGKKTVIKKRYALDVRATSVSSPGLSDAARAQVRTR